MQGLFGSGDYSFEIFGDGFKMRIAIAVWKIFSDNVQLLGCRHRQSGDLNFLGVGLFQGSMVEGERRARELGCFQGTD